MKAGPPEACNYDSLDAATCNPWANRDAGDFVILWDQSGSSTKLWLRTWQGTKPNLTLGAPVELDATVSEAMFSDDGFRGEAAVNLTDTVFAGTTGCQSYANTIPSTVTGNSDTADYKDTILRQAPPISNCGTLIVKKVIKNDNGGSKVASDFSFDWGKVGDATTNVPFESDGSNSIGDLSGIYSVTEPAVVGYATTYDNCTAVDIGPGVTETCTITNDAQPGTLIVKKVVTNDSGGTKTAADFSFTYGPDGGSATMTATFEADGENSVTVNSGKYDVTEPADAGYTTAYDNCSDVFVPNGGSATCTITNDDKPGTLIVTKVITNDNGGTATFEDFTFTYGLDGEASTTTATFEADGSNSISVKAGTYDVTETPVAGYTPLYSCDNIVVPNGGSIECVITNDDQQGTLIVHKKVVNDSGGTLAATDFSFQVNGGDATAFLQDGDNALLGKNTLSVDSGKYTVTEPAVTGYTADVSNCIDVFVPNGGIAECTITNDDQQGALIVNKVVVNDNGGTATPDAFTFTYGLDGQPGTDASFEADGSNSLAVNARTTSPRPPSRATR